MMKPSSIQPDIELKNHLSGHIYVGSGTDAQAVTVYSDWERPTNNLPDDFIVIFINGDIDGVGMDTPFARGFIMVNLYCKLNDNGSVKKSRVNKILTQFDDMVEKAITANYYFEYEPDRFITPTTPNQASGYSVTTLNLRWNTISNFNK